MCCLRLIALCRSFLCAAILIPLLTPYISAQTVGASVPFLTYEAESSANQTNGAVVSLTGQPGPNDMSPQLEASGRAFVELRGTGKWLAIPVTAAANALVLRHSIPDAPQGGGLQATLSLYVNGEKRQSLTFTSKFNWLYGAAGGNGQSNDPAAGTAHVFWDESRFWLQGGVQPGDVLTLQVDECDTAAFYRIDLAELEDVPAPLGPPAGQYLSVSDFGADPSGATDSTAAFKSAITAAGNTSSRVVWIPAGTYTLTSKLELNGVKVRGAGMWYSNLLFPNVGVLGGSYAQRKVTGFALVGDGAEVHDLYVENTGNTLRINNGDYGFADNNATPGVIGTNWRVENVWLVHAQAGFWLRGKGGSITGSRVRFSFADGINLNNGASNITVSNNHLRGTGDDSIAVLSQSSSGTPLSRNNVVLNNTVVAPWWAAGIDLAGGDGHLIDSNVIQDSTQAAALVLNLTTAYAIDALTNSTLQNNLIIRGGGNVSNQQRGAIWVYPASNSISGVVFRSNVVRSPLFRGIHIVGPKSTEITFDQNVVDSPTMEAYVMASTSAGTGTYTQNAATNVPTRYAAFANYSGSYTCSQSGNSWN